MKNFPALPALLTLMLTGCFTGVESTPKITGSDVKKERVVTTPEDTYLRDVTDAPIPAWESGKRFIVTDDKIKLIFGSTAPATTLAGKTITYAGASEAVSITGGNVTDLTFRSPEGATLVYRVNQPLKEISGKSAFSVPFTIQESMVNDASTLLKGKKLYILTRSWRDDDDNSVTGRQFVPVTITDVSAGNSIYPLKLSFTDNNGVSARVFMIPGVVKGTPRTFPTLFSFTDPYKKYSHISPENWERITKGQVVLGMTREECRLALGAPKEIDRAANNSYLREVWLYETGIYLVFEDGILKLYRR
ncbi:MAG: hypothetical protein K2J65_07565 [Duncaniella sp.]|nr:hypothetical protein [Duncaniella sp.]